jgi:hypothetical protein
VIALRCGAMRCCCIITVCHGLAGWWGAIRDPSGGLRDGDGIPVQSAAKLACATAGLGSSAGLAAFPGMACASPGVAVVD